MTNRTHPPKADAADPITAAREMVATATRDRGYRQRLLDDPIAVYRDAGIDVPAEHRDAVTQLVGAQIAQFETMKEYGIPFNESAIDPTPLDPARMPALAAASGYVTIAARPWGVVVTLSDQAVRDLQNGQMGVAGVTAAIAAAVAAIPGGQIPAAFVGAAAGVIALHSAVIGLANRGKGVYLTWLWTSLACVCTLGLPLPTPVT